MGFWLRREEIRIGFGSEESEVQGLAGRFEFTEEQRRIITE